MRIDGVLVRLGSSSFLLLGLFRGPGCSASMTTSGSDHGGSTAPAATPEDKSGGDPSSFAEDAAAPMPPNFRGNPLCHVTDAVCMPDEDGTKRTANTQACAQAYDADGGQTPARGCRLQRTTGSTSALTPMCDGASWSGTDGFACQTGADCAPGFDCAEGEKGSVCRRYCCSDSCDAQASASGGKTFCDVQKLVDTKDQAPVCMPLKACKLLSAGACAATETCAVVTEAGDTGCVEIGQAQVNDACDTEHCAVGLTCIGQPGARKCYQLCKVSASSCGPNLVCKTSTLFKDPAYGVCQKPTSTY